MKELIIPKSYPVLAKANEVNEICLPLINLLGIDFFTFARVYNNGEVAVLNNSGYISEIFYKELYYNRFLFDGQMPSIVNNHRFILWAAFDNNPLLAIFKKDFKLKDGVLVIEEAAGFIDYYNFGTSKSPAMINFAITHFELIENFIFYFKEKAKDLILDAVKCKFSIPSNADSLSKNDFFIEAQDKINRFYKELKIRKYYLNPIEEKTLYLTRREFKTSMLSLFGFSAKEIANALDISSRTVEHHVKNARRKINFCKKKINPNFIHLAMKITKLGK